MPNSYTYLLGWTAQNRWYYGRRTANKLPPQEDFWDIYRGSSKYVGEFIREYGEPDRREIRREFESKEGCCDWEQRVLKKLGAVKSEKWLNRHDKDGSFGYGMLGKVAWNKGKAWSKEVKIKLCKPKRITASQRQAIRERNSKRRGPLHPRYGKPGLLGKANPLFGKHGADHPKSKWYKVTDPNGNVVIVKGLSKFCKDRGLTQPCMMAIINGKQSNHRGWRCEKYGS